MNLADEGIVPLDNTWTEYLAGVESARARDIRLLSDSWGVIISVSVLSVVVCSLCNVRTFVESGSS